MRILVVSNMWPSPLRPTRGIFVKEQVDSLVAAGLQVDVLHFDGSGRKKVAYLKLPLLLRQRIKAFTPDVVHAHYGLTGAFCFSRASVPLAVTYHGSDLLIPWQHRFSRWSARRADVNVCVSEALKAKLGDPDARVIPCGVDTNRFCPSDRAAARKKLQLPADAPVALFGASKSNPIKDHPLFESALRSTGRPEILTLELSGVSRDLVSVYMNAADVMVMTSKYEGYSLVVTEALACGLPVVSVPVGDIPDRIAQLSQCHVVDRHPADIARAIVSTLDARTRIQPIPPLTGLTANDSVEGLKAIYADLSAGARR